MNRTHIGIVGTGMMLEYHLRAFRDLPDVSFVGCTREYYGNSRQREQQHRSLQDIAGRFGIEAYPTYAELLGDGRLDAVIVASINPYHFEHIRKALDAGLDVLAEKPVVTDLAQLEILRAKAAGKGRLLFPAHNFVYRPAIAKAKEILDAGALGTLVYAQFISCFRSGEAHARGWRASAAASGGGALMDSGHHQVYQSIHLLGFPEKIQAFRSRQVLTWSEGEDFAMINARYRDGCIANIGQGHGSDFGEPVSGIRIVGEKGNIVVGDACYHNGTKVADGTGYAESFRHQAAHFLACRAGRTQPRSDLDDARDTLRIIQAAYRSAEKDEVVSP